MAKKQKKHSGNSPSWSDVQRRYRLSDQHVEMAKELGMNPKKMGSLANQNQEPWKSPLPDFIEEVYQKRFGKRHPD